MISISLRFAFRPTCFARRLLVMQNLHETSTQVHLPLIAHKRTVMLHFKTRILSTGTPNRTLKIPHQGPVAQRLVSANRWLRGIKTYRFPWYLSLVSANHASSNPGQKACIYGVDVSDTVKAIGAEIDKNSLTLTEHSQYICYCYNFCFNCSFLIIIKVLF